jgi:hypothetical protein
MLAEKSGVGQFPGAIVPARRGRKMRLSRLLAGGVEAGMHGLRVSIRGHEGKWPASTTQLAQTG